FEELAEARQAGAVPKPVLIGPLTFLWLGKEKQAGFNRLDLLPALLPVYVEVLRRLGAQGAEWVQMDEPALVQDLPTEWLNGLRTAYSSLGEAGPKLLLATYFGSVAPLAAELNALPVAGLHLDLHRAPEQLPSFLADFPRDKVLSAGVVDGRNIWRNDLDASLELLEAAHLQVGDRLWLAPSCPLLHVPVDLERETDLDPELKEWLAFAVQKLGELAILGKALEQGRESVMTELQACRRSWKDRNTSPRVRNEEVHKRLACLPADADRRRSTFAVRRTIQRQALKLPPFPTTTIGSFPQTGAIRSIRAAFKQGRLSETEYRDRMKAEIRIVVERQEELGLDVLVHGEPERNDMVEYFGEQLAGFAFTRNGWVQSYGSRCVKPPVLFGDVWRPGPMTVEWIRYAQGLTDKPMKGIVTGPITILQWSFVRDDQPKSETAMQIALAIRDEVLDLESAGTRVIQIDEPAFREGLPLRRSEWGTYLPWATRAFRLSASGVKDGTQIHTHMCYAEFNDIFPAIVDLDADVISIETSRSDMELLEGFGTLRYPNEIGPGVYDVHSPRVPKVAEMVRLLEKACAVVDSDKLWVNPDCGLKTRQWPEVDAALRNMVTAAKTLRRQNSSSDTDG
ncbi:MAG TPA: 5-methyltetrahydropteroyltriglutamate--homocysteine S-methyltransferase, partial [Candidatus Deferrimicrobium sp.]|nr:5-methyltetrahydropteroyltriglutamate--homocysteine S-methyltransferase [Candidatus Deferrimicrobium sp.]